MKTTWKDITPVPTSQEFLDIVLSRTQRRLPTQIRSGFKISRIRGFYTRKVKFTSETCTEKFDAILNGFPRLADIHPFHADLLNTLYSRDHLKISLGQISTAKHLVETISRDYVRLIKYAQSLYQCKQLKRAALGRMATLVKRLKDPLLYLDQVREHLGRLPSIDPTTRTLLICGYPNVGKSSFLKSVTRADVEVEPYAFTTKSLFVGHFDYKYLRFQAIDTPGLLDSPLESKGPIELQSITAIAHLRSALLYFFDLINKIDVMRPEDLDAETAQEFQSLLTAADVEMLQLSCNTQEGVQEVKNAACERLIADRAAAKVKAGTNNSGDVGGRLADVMKRIHVAVPDGPVRESFIPEAVKNMKKYEKTDPERRRLARDIEEENGGAGVYNVDLRADYLLENDEWKQDRIPEIFDGKNVYDHKEERLEAEGFYESEEEIDDEEEAQIRTKAELIREKQALLRNEARMRKSLKNRAVIPRKLVKQPLSELEEGLDVLGVDTTDLGLRARAQANTRGRSVTRSRMGTEDADAMDVDSTPRDRLRSKSRARSPQMNRREDGVADEKAKEKAERQMKLGQRKMNRMAKQGEADRHVGTTMPKHLFAGKRSMGKTSRR
ncbi:nucleolar gtp-binding protein 1 protein [Apiospora marii]|uniref:nucleolar gtp-binding protein 1 protein n=1 Tax=Apiospora marii TaxID=335849 RepID=UPI0031310AD4